jgi:hypothetical protein
MSKESENEENKKFRDKLEKISDDWTEAAMKQSDKMIKSTEQIVKITEQMVKTGLSQTQDSFQKGTKEVKKLTKNIEDEAKKITGHLTSMLPDNPFKSPDDYLETDKNRKVIPTDSYLDSSDLSRYIDKSIKEVFNNVELTRKVILGSLSEDFEYLNKMKIKLENNGETTVGELQTTISILIARTLEQLNLRLGVSKFVSKGLHEMLKIAKAQKILSEEDINLLQALRSEYDRIFFDDETGLSSNQVMIKIINLITTLEEERIKRIKSEK